VIFDAVAQERQPRGTAGALSRPAVTGENPANHVFVDLDVERQGNLLGDSRTARIGITLLHFDDHRASDGDFAILVSSWPETSGFDEYGNAICI
jgi:hypothetical protein